MLSTAWTYLYPVFPLVSTKERTFIRFYFYFKDNFFNVLIFFREAERKERGRDKDCCSAYLCIHWLLLVHALTQDQTPNLGEPGRLSTNRATRPEPHSFFSYKMPSSSLLLKSLFQNTESQSPTEGSRRDSLLTSCP